MLVHALRRPIMLCIMLMLLLPASSIWAESVITDSNLAKAILLELHESANHDLKQEDLKKLTSLYPKSKDSNGKITSLQGLEHATNLKSLMLPGQGLSDIKPIGELNQLIWLALDGNEIDNLAPVSGLTNLKNLNVNNNRIQSLQPLEKLSILTDLYASNNQIQSIEPLKNHPELEYLSLANNQIQDIAALETIPNLKSVVLKNNPLNEQASQTIEILRQRGVAVDGIKPMEKPETNDIHVTLDELPVQFEVPPFISDGKTFVPFRPIFEKLGLKITWLGDSKTIIGEKEGVSIQIHIDELNAEVNGQPVQLTEPPKLISGTTFVPLRFVAESVGSKVEWDGSSRMVTIKSKHSFVSSDGTFRVTAFGNWVQTGGTQESVMLRIEGGSFNAFMVNVFPKQEGVELNQFYENIMEQNWGDDEADRLEETEVIFQGLPAKQAVFNFAAYKQVFTIFLFEANNHFYLITTMAKKADLKVQQEELAQIRDSFEFIEP
ncbi:stalk domain-containing protein [Paenibacillus piri]|uniref:Copper amine oxidase-like N-terminal domain-containing protein n=1 Tax=Paenibacillus piri TaxID=2547395 RepID=A0A4R5KFQ5_9BACL|nr:stalk domain-containing protein [Paenibacillus piri]TDF94116.1 hypothetical protein E1757_24820 [Paenibacillus piri]